ncbi:MAG: fumarate hydratase C-terminal domain-containing protein [Clostridia bacterium]|nr:fumarate hydratase C-terminal domain-containing protein [Clostridia bacterium]
MAEFYFDTNEVLNNIQILNAGDRVFLSGVVYTARDAAHKRIKEMIDNNQDTPFPLNDSFVYYAGPTPTPEGLAIGSCGPTTSSRMDFYAPLFLDMGLKGMIGKGPRNQDVIDAIIRNKAIYFCATGGAGALASKCIVSCDVIAFDDLGCESVKKLVFKEFPLIVGIDSEGNTIF